MAVGAGRPRQALNKGVDAMDSYKRNFLIGCRQWLNALPFLLFGFILMAMFILYPLLRNIWISFTEFNVIKNEVTAYVGAKNYLDLFRDKNYLLAFRNTLLYTLVTVSGQMFFGLVLACLIAAMQWALSKSKK